METLNEPDANHPNNTCSLHQSKSIVKWSQTVDQALCSIWHCLEIKVQSKRHVAELCSVLGENEDSKDE